MRITGQRLNARERKFKGKVAFWRDDFSMESPGVDGDVALQAVDA